RARYAAQARSSSARPPSPVATSVTDPAPDADRARAVAPATTKPAHNASSASATARAPTVPAVVFWTTVRPDRSAWRIRPGELVRSKPRAGARSFRASQPG